MARTRARVTEEMQLNQEEPKDVTQVPEVPRSPRTPRPRKNKQMVVTVWASPRFKKFSVVDKGKAITTEPTEEDDDWQALIDQIDTQVEEE